MRRVCVKCQRFFKIKRNGVVVEEGMPLGDRWIPYKLYSADLYECEKCGTQLAICASESMAEHYMAHYKAVKERAEIAGLLMPIVEDC